jgi:hypothetical protein
MGRPLWAGAGSEELFFASTRRALDLVQRYTGIRLRKRELPLGSLVAACDGRVVARERFRPDLSFEEEPLPPVRAPGESEFCLKRLAALAAA